MIDYAAYFSLGDCMEGLNMIFNSLYNINLVFEDIEPGEGWAEQVYKLAGKNIISIRTIFFLLFNK